MSNEEILNSLEEEVKQAKTNNELNEIRIKYHYNFLREGVRDDER